MWSLHCLTVLNWSLKYWHKSKSESGDPEPSILILIMRLDLCKQNVFVFDFELYFVILSCAQLLFLFWIIFCCCCTRSGITLPPAPSNGNTSQSATKDIMFQNTSLWLTLTKTLLQRCGIDCQLWHISYGRKWPRRLNPSKRWNSS